jgi:hypothetical protein
LHRCRPESARKRRVGTIYLDHDAKRNAPAKAVIDEILVALTEFKREKTKFQEKQGQREFGRYRNRPSAAQFGRGARSGKLRHDVNDPGLIFCAQYFSRIKPNMACSGRLKK